MKRIYFLTLFFSSIIIFSTINCNSEYTKEKLSVSVKTNLALLQNNPQFIMYANIKEMRKTQFWKDNIQDSLISAERIFGNILNMFSNATGTSISDGLDEIYLSNSWMGENTFILKGSFDRAKTEKFITNDSFFVRINRPDGSSVFKYFENNLYFFFKDNYTICASNFLSRIDEMKLVTDTSKTGILTNDVLMNAIENVAYKQNLWMVSTEKLFIRGVFMNFFNSKNIESSGLQEIDTLITLDSLSETEDLLINNLYKRINSLGFSVKMKKDLKINIVLDCIDFNSADYITKLFNGMIAMSKLGNIVKKEKQSTAIDNILDNLEITTLNNLVYSELKIDKENIDELRKNPLLKKPN